MRISGLCAMAALRRLHAQPASSRKRYPSTIRMTGFPYRSAAGYKTASAVGWAAEIASARLDLESLGRSSSRRPEVVATYRTLALGSDESILNLRPAVETGTFYTL